MSDVRRAEIKPCLFNCQRDCAWLCARGMLTVHLTREHLLALADDLAAILDTDGSVPKHARVAS